MRVFLCLLGLMFIAGIPPLGADDEPIRAYGFVVEIEGIDAGSFSEVSGLGGEIEVIEYQNGDDILLRKRPGRAKFGDITLKRGFVGSSPVLEWFDEVRGGTTQRRDIVLTLQDDRGISKGSWTLSGCWPKAWRVGGVRDGEMTLVEEVVLVVEEITFTPPTPVGTK